MQPDDLYTFLGLLFAYGSSVPLDLWAASVKQTGGELFVRTDLVRVSTESELVEALTNPDKTQIQLQNDIIIMNTLQVNRAGTVTIDLQGYRLATIRAHTATFDILAGELILTGAGSILANGVDAAVIRIKGAMTAENTNYAKVTVGPEITLFAPNYYAVLVVPNCGAAYGTTVELQGKIVARDGICINSQVRGLGENAPRMRIADGASIEVDEDAGTLVGAFGYGIWEIGAATLIGATGIDLKSGQVRLLGTRIVATGTVGTEKASEVVGLGAVVRIEEKKGATGDIELTFDTGEYTSKNSYIVARYGDDQNLRRLEILAGNYQAAGGLCFGLTPRLRKEKRLVIAGGNFPQSMTKQITDYLAPERRLEKTYAGSVAVIDPNPPELDPVERLELEVSNLRNLVERAGNYLDDEYAGDELGDWQASVNKAMSAIKRALTAANKLLRSKQAITMEQVMHAEQRIHGTIQGIQTIEDELQTELLTAIAAGKAIDPRDYSMYSYKLLMEAILPAEQLVQTGNVTINTLYSALCDINMNIELLDDPDENEDPQAAGLMAFLPDALPDVMPETLPELAMSAPLLPEPAEMPDPLEPLDITDDIEIEPEEVALEDEFFESIEEAEELEEFAAEIEAFAEPEEELSLPELEESELSPLDDEVFALMELGASVILAALDSPELEAEAAPEPISAPITESIPEPIITPEPTAISEPISAPVEPSIIPAQPIPAAAQPILTQPAPAQPASAGPEPTPVQTATTSTPTALSMAEAEALVQAWQSLQAMVEVVQDLKLSDYQAEHAEQFGELQVAIVRANAVLKKTTVELPEILDAMDAVKFATAGLQLEPQVEPAPKKAKVITPKAIVESQPKPVETAPPATQENSVDWSALREVVADIAKLNARDYTTATYNNVLANLERAKALLANSAALQSDIDDLVFELNLSMLGLERAVQAPVSQQFTEIKPVHATEPQANITKEPNLFNSISAGLMTYRRSRLVAKQQKIARKMQVFSNISQN